MSELTIIEMPVARKLREATESGRICRECGVQFTEAHGHEVACEYCWKRLPSAERAEVYRATFPEVNREAHKTLARKRRNQRTV